MTRPIVLALLPILCLSLAAGAEESSYNRAVDAYRAKKYEHAFRLWSEAAAQGSVDALNNLGFLRYNGYGVTKDQAAATDLWRIAAYAGHSEAKWHLGEAYEKGRGVTADRARAYAWYRCAVASARWKVQETNDETERVILKDAEQSLGTLAPLLQKNDLARGGTLAKECIQRYGRPAL